MNVYLLTRFLVLTFITATMSTAFGVTETTVRTNGAGLTDCMKVVESAFTALHMNRLTINDFLWVIICDKAPR